MKIEDQVRTAVQEYADRIQPNSTSWTRIAKRMHASQPRPWAGLAVAMVAAATLAAIVAVRLIGGQPDRVELLTPPGEEPGQVFVSPDGDWQLRFPKEWHLQARTPQDGLAPELGAWSISSDDIVGVTPHSLPSQYPDLPADHIEIALSIISIEPAGSISTDDALGKCRKAALEPSSPPFLECETREINGRTWGRYALEYPARDAESSPVRLIQVFLMTQERGYMATAVIFGTDDLASRVAQVDRVVSTFAIREPD